MSDRPIIFSAPMVLALLAGRKTQTRRLAWWLGVTPPVEMRGVRDGPARIWQRVQVGDRLWVRENWKPHSIYAGLPPREMPQAAKVFYKADDGYAPSNTPWVPSIHMPRWASRLTLAVSAVRLQRLQDISEEDARAEGHVNNTEHPDSVVWATDVWDVLHGEGSWRSNPEVVALTFTMARSNIDDLAKAA